ncbi:permease [Fimbriiglobus ruber]|uniref:Permease n=1 Tax=Fimbriiglobus ruber TaxID=1908690 RepID=A0A225E918_9BACT|nr:permease [Fimbriiglobus ruber]OWK47248.1 permease [Fimbriiglobus ruber]
MDTQIKTQVSDFVVTFSSILWEAMPFIVLGAVIAGILEELLPQQLIGRIIPRSALPAAIIGGLLGLIFPMCECGIVVVMRRLLRKGLPLASCISYMLAGPIVNVIVLLSTYVAFGGLNKGGGLGWQMVALRAGLGFFVAVVTGCVVHLVQKKYGNAALLTPLALPPKASSLSLQMAGGDAEEAPQKRQPWLKRIGNISETALHDFLDITVFLTLGAALAAVAKSAISTEDIQSLTRNYPLLAIPAMMFLAVILCLCSEADAFVAASFTEMSVSSKLAFLVLGPMLDLKLLLMYTRVFRARLIAVIVTCTIIQSGVYSVIVHRFYNPAPGATGSSDKAPVESPSPAP